MKPFKTIDEQYDLLLSRGLAFTNEEKSKTISSKIIII